MQRGCAQKGANNLHEKDDEKKRQKLYRNDTIQVAAPLWQVHTSDLHEPVCVSVHRNQCVPNVEVEHNRNEADQRNNNKRGNRKTLPKLGYYRMVAFPARRPPVSAKKKNSRRARRFIAHSFVVTQSCGNPWVGCGVSMLAVSGS